MTVATWEQEPKRKKTQKSKKKGNTLTQQLQVAEDLNYTATMTRELASMDHHPLEPNQQMNNVKPGWPNQALQLTQELSDIQQVHDLDTITTWSSRDL